jgi:hypothetical protein
MRQFFLFWRTVLILSLSGGAATAGVNVLTYHNDNSRTGDNLSETNLTPANVNVDTFGKLFAYSVDGDIYAQPMYVSGLAIPGKGTHNVVFVATEHNSVYAFNADSDAGDTRGLLWQINLGASVTTPNPDFGNRYGGFNQITPETGITGTPVIDLGTQTLYVDSFTEEGSNYVHRLHALDIANGRERAFSPVTVSASIAGNGVGGTNGIVTFDAKQELQRSALTLASGILYVCYAGYGDTDPYHGWILGYNPANLKLSTNHIFNSTPNSTVVNFGDDAGEAGIWMAGCGLSEDSSGNLYLATGNGSFNAFNGSGGTEYGDTFLKLSPSREMSVLDYFTPYNQAYLADNDIDLGSGGVLLVPNQPGPIPHMIIGGGKQGTVYVINRDMFTTANNHYNTNGNYDAVLQTVALNGGDYETPAYFNGMVYFTASEDVTAAFSISNGVLSLPAGSTGSRTFPFPGATASVSANGQNNGILWLIERANPATLIADDANDVSSEIYNSDQAGDRDQLPSGIKFAVPTIANGKVFVGGHDALSVYGLLPFANTPAPGNYCGLFYASNGVQISQSGYLNFTVSKSGHYLARLLMASNICSFTGQFYGAGATSTSLKVGGQSPLEIQMQYAGANPTVLTGTIGNCIWTANIIADEELFNARTNPCPYAGEYTVVVHSPNNGDSAEPQGNGFGTVSISAAGQLKFQGTLADGTPVSQVTTVSSTGQWPLYASLYGGHGQILGWVNFADTPSSDLSSDLAWIKLSGIKLASANAKIYPAGFAFAPVLEGSRFRLGTARAPVLDFSAGELTLTGGAFSGGFTNYFTVGPNGKVSSTNKSTLTLAASTGRFTGTSPNPLGGHTVSFSGVFLTKENYGAGYFIDSGLSGAVYLGPQ